ncbi:fimbrial protein [Stenotrophomonas sp. RAC2]|uniref:fimbrial protein n=1 Tax=Stenotrophomonas sp. RAC2 TaxID=3064902 RepID=UPI002726D55B|nr:fimbrial protein [Stenotrophomonas sp. RAC2]MDV9043863.1 fimbrial protein [Stenotrophomonas sp. RAC2]
MNKLAIALSAALSLGAASTASAADAVINFEGQITALTCKIGVGTGVSDTLTMPTISPKAISSAAAARQQAFELTMGTVGETCAAGTVTLSFEDVNLDADGYLENTELPAAGGAADVRMAIRDTSGPLNLKTATLTKTIDATGIASWPLVASYEPTAGGTPGEGTFKSALHVSVKY